jgi:hypothetical protein
MAASNLCDSYNEEGMEVNLGNSEQGLGEDQPFLPGKPAPSDAQAYTPPPKAEPVKEEDVKDIATDDKHEDAPEIKKPPVVKPKPEATKVPEKQIVKTIPVKNPEPVTNPTPPAPKPKAVFKGVNGTGTGGNESDDLKKEETRVLQAVKEIRENQVVIRIQKIIRVVEKEIQELQN